MKRLLIVAGETSGDGLGADLVREVVARDPAIEFSGLGGPKMAAAGVNVLQDLTNHAVVGSMGLLGNLGGLLRAYRLITHELSANKPDAIILIDFPDFNLMVAKHAKAMGVPVIYYVSPQLWAWRSGRIKLIKERVRKMLVFFDFEREMYEKAGVDVTHVGHPLLDVLDPLIKDSNKEEMRKALGLAPENRLVGLVPGSRKSEVERVFPVLLQSAELLAKSVPNLQFAVPRAPNISPGHLGRIGNRYNIKFVTVDYKAHELMVASDLLLICSGTATLEAGVLGTPMVATYKTDIISSTLFGPFIKTGFYALPNIVAGEEIIPEFYVFNAKPNLIAKAAEDILTYKLGDTRKRLELMRAKLGERGAAARAAAEVIKLL